MRSKRIAMSLTALVANVAAAHPGHPALSPQHTHAPYEVDPALTLALALVAAAVAVVFVTRSLLRRRAPLRRRK